jgi:hypothetical protein
MSFRKSCFGFRVSGGPYLASNRLQQGGGIWGKLNWTYDGVGNSTSETLSPGYSNTYNYAAGNN